MTVVSVTQGLGLHGELQATRLGPPFSTGERKLLAAALRTTLAAAHTARLHKQAVEAALSERETQRAAEVAQLAMPTTPPHLEDVDVFFANEQATNTGGDLFCFHVEGDQLSFAVGDVSGKGLSAAVMMTTAVCAAGAAFRDQLAPNPGDQLRLVNEWMYEHLSAAGLFISLFVGHYRRGTNELRWANAGHSPCLVSTTTGTRDLMATAPPLGVLSAIDDTSRATDLDEDDVVLIGSDGLVEQTTKDSGAFGETRLHDVLSSMRGLPASHVGAELLSAVAAFAGATPQSDDRTAVLLRQTSGATP